MRGQLSVTQGGGGADWEHTQAGQRIASLDVHGTAPADTLPAAPSECQCWVDLVLDPDQRIEDHGSRLVQVQLVGLHEWLLVGRVWIPAVDFELLDVRRLLAGHGGRGL